MYSCFNLEESIIMLFGCLQKNNLKEKVHTCYLILMFVYVRLRIIFILFITDPFLRKTKQLKLNCNVATKPLMKYFSFSFSLSEKKNTRG